MLKQIKAVIFDLDGVIINSNPAIEAFWKSWTDRENITLTDALTRQWIHGRKAVDTVTGLFHQLPPARQQDILDAAFIFDSTMKPAPVNGVVQFIRQLHHFGIPTGVVTSSHHSRMFQFLANIGIETAFNDFVTAHDVTNGKPHPEPYQMISKKLGVPADNCIVFEDAISGLKSAVAAGMHAIGIGDDSAQKELRSHGASEVIPDFAALTIRQTGVYLEDAVLFSF